MAESLPPDPVMINDTTATSSLLDLPTNDVEEWYPLANFDISAAPSISEGVVTIRINNSSPNNITFCLDCVRPYYITFCSGKQATCFYDCEKHKIKPDRTLNHDAIKGVLHIGDWQMLEHFERLVLNGDDFSSEVEPTFWYMRTPECRADEVFREASSRLNAEWIVTNTAKVHQPGCMLSGKPEVIIAGTRGAPSEKDRPDEESIAKGNLATSLYFKRCDGVYKNIQGEKLETD